MTVYLWYSCINITMSLLPKRWGNITTPDLKDYCEFDCNELEVIDKIKKLIQMASYNNGIMEMNHHPTC